jgi:hypothetical protein
MFAYTGTAIGNSNPFGGRSHDEESSRDAVGLAEVMAVSARVICEHWGTGGRVKVADVCLQLEGDMLGSGQTVLECTFEVGSSGVACILGGLEKSGLGFACA